MELANKPALSHQADAAADERGPDLGENQNSKNREGKGLRKKGEKVVKCQRCKGTGVR